MSAFLQPLLGRFDVLAFPTFALALFVVVFALLVLRARRLDAPAASRLAALPLADDAKEP